MQTFETTNKPVKAWVDGVEFDENARRQVANMAALPFVHSHVAVMPDVHVGIGATVGSVIPTIGAIVPAAVGVDLERETAGIECRKDQGVVDEAPSAYKSIEAVMEAQRDLVEIVHEFRQVVCIKG